MINSRVVFELIGYRGWQGWMHFRFWRGLSETALKHTGQCPVTPPESGMTKWNCIKNLCKGLGETAILNCFYFRLVIIVSTMKNSNNHFHGPWIMDAVSLKSLSIIEKQFRLVLFIEESSLRLSAVSPRPFRISECSFNWSPRETKMQLGHLTTQLLNRFEWP